MEGSKRKRSDNEGGTTAKKSHLSSTPILEVVYLMHMFDIATLSSLTWVIISVLGSDHDCIAVMFFCRCKIRVMS